MKEQMQFITESELLNSITIGEMIDFIVTYIKKEVMKSKIKVVLSSMFAKIERNDIDVGDVVVNAEYYSLIRKHCGDVIDPTTKKDEIQKGFMCKIWNTNLWVNSRAAEINCYSKDCEQLEKDFPEIIEAKKQLNL